MKKIDFWKMHGSGNDFVLIDNRDGNISEADVGPLAEKVCRRRESVGADGLILVMESGRHDFAWRYLNADGGEVEMCGNGGRCVARFAYLKGIAGPEMTFETLTGPVSAKVNGRMVKVLMPKPSDLRLDIDLEPRQGWREVDFINTGVPHVVVHVEDLSAHPVVEEGRAIRYHEMFSPSGTNANFVRVLGPDLIENRTYERGVEDETLACGTGAIAAALVSAARERVRSPTRVRTRGGEELRIHFVREGNGFRDVYLEGSTSIVYQAQLHEEALE
ncbi:MAG: diaminopimelate epimerase [Deltaproteobacteria bacterium]|nr:diaminopimelate epimerase [Deltaproteobacteria bacterium]MBW2136878.1 diaminopimelate epimerase [Deltaproteobacteria bacterium]